MEQLFPSVSQTYKDPILNCDDAWIQTTALPTL